MKQRRSYNCYPRIKHVRPCGPVDSQYPECACGCDPVSRCIAQIERNPASERTPRRTKPDVRIPT